MAKKTFHNLQDEKQRRFIEASLNEFADKPYDSASVTQIVNRLEIAKGSIYQYFIDKTDLWLYLKNYCERKRLSYSKDGSRSNYMSFWDYYLELQGANIEFDCDYPVMGRFLHRVNYKETNPGLSVHISEWKQNTFRVYSKLVEAEILIGGFPEGSSVRVISNFLVGMNMVISENLQDRYNELIRDRGVQILLKKSTRDSLKSEVVTHIELMRRAVQS